MQIEFKTKVKDGIVRIPVIKRHHCDMNAVMEHKKLRVYANSKLFEAVLCKLLHSIGVHIGAEVPIDALPPCVTVKPGFLHTFTIEVPND